MGGQGSRRMQLLDDLRDMTRYWNLKEGALVGTFWKTHFGIGYGLIARDIVIMFMFMIMVMNLNKGITKCSSNNIIKLISRSIIQLIMYFSTTFLY